MGQTLRLAGMEKVSEMEYSTDRRREMREKVAIPVLYTVGHKTMLEKSHDISSNGISVFCPYKPAIGEQVRLRFTHPREHVYVRANGRVVYVEGDHAPDQAHRIGIHLSDISRPGLAAIF